MSTKRTADPVTDPVFPDPEISWPLIRRRLADEMLHLFDAYIEICRTRGMSVTWNHSFPDRHKYHCAVNRLRKRGLIARREGMRGGSLLLTEEGVSRLRPVMRPHRYWGARWNGIWYVLVYDVPESKRAYRDTLRCFLKRLNLGCLQRSVWITPRDIRAEFADLAEAAAVGDYAFLFQAQTVLGMPETQIPARAWNFEKINEDHQWYLNTYSTNLRRFLGAKRSREALEHAAREELAAYLTAMQNDPLLPGSLLPTGYAGRAVYETHCGMVEEIAERL